jgi:enoyl-CoA hydratase/carnithine racemase
MSMIHFERYENIAILKLSRGVTNAINLELIDELSGTLKKVQDDSDIRGLVLTSANEKFFSIGLDIPWLFPLSRENFTSFYRAFNRLCIDLFTLPKLTVAAIAGHAIAGGCILTLCCDYRFVAEGRKLMGLNEIKLGVPVPYPADCILRNLVGFRVARDMMDTGEFYQGEELLKLGIVDEALPTDQMLAMSIEKAQSLSGSSPQAWAIIKRNRVERVETEILAHLEEKEKVFVEQWYAPETRERLKQAMEKF